MYIYIYIYIYGTAKGCSRPLSTRSKATYKRTVALQPSRLEAQSPAVCSAKPMRGAKAPSMEVRLAAVLPLHTIMIYQVLGFVQ